MYYNYANIAINFNENLFIGCTPLRDNGNYPIYKKKTFYSLWKNGYPFFYEKENDTFFNEKFIFW